MSTDCEKCAHEEVCNSYDFFDNCVNFEEKISKCVDCEIGSKFGILPIKESVRQMFKYSDYVRYKFCPWCGHKIDWSKE